MSWRSGFSRPHGRHVDGNGLVSPMQSGRPIALPTLPKMLQLHEIAAVAHGFRLSFRDQTAKRTEHSREVIAKGMLCRSTGTGHRRPGTAPGAEEH